MAYLISKKKKKRDKYTLSGLSPTCTHTIGFSEPISLAIDSTSLCFKYDFK